MQQGSILPFLQKSKPPRSDDAREQRSGQPYHPRGSHHRRGRGSMQHRGPNRRRNSDLKKIADETKDILPQVLSDLPGFDAMESSIHDLKDLAPLDPSKCPGFTLSDNDQNAGQKGTRIRVHDMDTFDAALMIAPDYKANIHITNIENKAPKPDSQQEDTDMKDASQNTTGTTPLTSFASSVTGHNSRPVAVLNLASERHAGGGWQNGALAQEEALCYRSSLYLSLHKSYYRLPSLSAIYSPNVLIIRDAMSRGHGLLLPAEKPEDLPVMAVISVAALRHPPLSDDKLSFKNEGLRAETKRKIRVTLRVAAKKAHSKLVLGALGCGVFGNPPVEVAKCFLEVMRESEFQGGWWADVVFAIMDNVRGEQGGKDGIGNFGVFYRTLDGEIV